MRFRVIGADRDTGNDVEIVVDAQDEVAAETIAAHQNMLVSQVLPDKLPPPFVAASPVNNVVLRFVGRDHITVSLPGKNTMNQPMKHPGIAAVLSFFFAGLGQIYNGQMVKGFAFLIAGIINGLLLLCFVLSGLLPCFVLIGCVTMPILWIWSVVDAYKQAESINRNMA